MPFSTITPFLNLYFRLWLVLLHNFYIKKRSESEWNKQKQRYTAYLRKERWMYIDVMNSGFVQRMYSIVVLQTVWNYYIQHGSAHFLERIWVTECSSGPPWWWRSLGTFQDLPSIYIYAAGCRKLYFDSLVYNLRIAKLSRGWKLQILWSASMDSDFTLVNQKEGSSSTVLTIFSMLFRTPENLESDIVGQTRIVA